MSKKKVLHLSSYPPQKGGIGIYLKQLLGELREQSDSFNHEVISFKEAEEGEAIPIMNRDDVSSFLDVFRYIIEQDPDILVVQHELNLFGRKNFLLLGGLLTLWKKFIRPETKIITSIHTHIQFPPGIQPKKMAKYIGYRKLTYGLIERYSDKIVLFDKNAEETTNLKNTTYIPLCGNVPENPKDVRSRFDVSPDEIMIGCAGFLTEEKNFHKIINAVSKLDEKYKLVINGSIHPTYEKGEKYLEKLKNIIEEKNLDSKVTLNQEFLSEDEMDNFFHSSDITVIAYEENNQSGNMYRAVCNKTKVICTDKESYREMLGTAAVYFSPITEDSIASAIKKHNNISDKELDNLQKRYGMDRAAEDHLKLFKELSES